MHSTRIAINGEISGDAGECDRMTERDQIAGTLGGLNGCDAGDADHIPLFCIALLNQCQGGGLHVDAAGRAGSTCCFIFGADIDHVRLAGAIKVSKILVGHSILQRVTQRGRGWILRLRYHSTMIRPPRLLALLLAFSLVLQPLRADDLPELGDAANNDLPLNVEKKIGLRIMHEIRWREPSYLDDPDIEAYLNQIGGRLAAVSSDPGFGYVFFPINDPSINAFAMPGGYIGVHTGLIISAQTESELAGVLAHEISHVSQRHIARQVFQSKQIGMASMAAMLVALLAARSNSQVAGAAIAGSQAGAISAQLAFSRDFERESDRLGFDILRKAGMDTRGMADFFERLQKSVRLYENNATAYLRTHPLTGERLTDMQNRQQSQSYRQVVDSVDFQLVRAKLRAMQGTPGEAIRMFRSELDEKKYASEAAVRYGLAYAHYRARDWSSAIAELEAIRQLRMTAPMLERMRAELALARGDVSAGLAVYRDGLVRYPHNKSMIYGYGMALIGAQRYSDALRFAESQLQNTPEDVRLHKMRAESYAGLGQRAMQHRALAEVFVLQGQTAGAVEQLNLAQKAGDANFFEMSAIDARLREMKRRQFDELKEKRLF